MIDISRGRYWGLPWSLISGCTPCSPGCDHCWAAGMTHRFQRHASLHDQNSLTWLDGKFNGTILTRPDRLNIPLKRRKPTVYAVWNDLHHEGVLWNFIFDAYRMMSNCPQHTFLVLTKRPHKMAANVEELWFHGARNSITVENVYHGLTVCNQQEADEKIPIFLQVPGKKFLSIEPMLGSINFGHIECRGWAECLMPGPHFPEGIDAVILGGETGSGARPLHPDWVRSMREQCAAAGVPFFFKSFGKYPPFGNYRLLDGRTHDELPWVTT